MATCGPPDVVLRDSPMHLLLKVIILSAIAHVLYIVLVLARDFFPVFNSTAPFNYLSTDFITYITLAVLQLALVTYWVLLWFRKKYVFTDTELHVHQGLFCQHQKTIPYTSIRTVEQEANLIGRKMGFANITIGTINDPKEVIIHAMPDSEAIVSYLGYYTKEAK